MEQVTTSESSQLSIIHPGEVMSRTSFFSDLAAEQLERLANSARVVSYKSNESIYELGDPAEDFFILVEGVVRFTIGLGGRRTSAGEIIRCGDVFGWAALIQGAATTSDFLLSDIIHSIGPFGKRYAFVDGGRPHDGLQAHAES